MDDDATVITNVEVGTVKDAFNDEDADVNADDDVDTNTDEVTTYDPLLAPSSDD